MQAGTTNKEATRARAKIARIKFKIKVPTIRHSAYVSAGRAFAGCQPGGFRFLFPGGASIIVYCCTFGEDTYYLEWSWRPFG